MRLGLIIGGKRSDPRSGRAVVEVLAKCGMPGLRRRWICQAAGMARRRRDETASSSTNASTTTKTLAGAAMQSGTIPAPSNFETSRRRPTPLERTRRHRTDELRLYEDRTPEPQADAVDARKPRKRETDEPRWALRAMARILARRKVTHPIMNSLSFWQLRRIGYDVRYPEYREEWHQGTWYDIPAAECWIFRWWNEQLEPCQREYITGERRRAVSVDTRKVDELKLWGVALAIPTRDE